MDMLARIRGEMLPFAELLGIEFVSVAPDKIVAEMTVREDLAAGMRIYREGGGDNAVLANVAIDLAERPDSADLARAAHVSLICPSDEARRRLKRVEALGFDEILLVSQTNSLEEVERARDFL